MWYLYYAVYYRMISLSVVTKLWKEGLSASEIAKIGFTVTEIGLFDVVIANQARQAEMAKRDQFSSSVEQM